MHFLRNGSPSNKKTPTPTPLAMVLCQCTECGLHFFWDYAVNEIRQGQIITETLAQAHRSREDSRRRDDGSRDSDDGANTDREPSHAGTNPNSHSRQDEKRKQRAERLMSSPGYVNTEISRTLDAITSHLEILRPDGFLPLVFANPPTTVNLDHVQAPVLDLLREDPINIPFLKYEQEVEGSIQDLERLQKDPHLLTTHSLRIKILLPKLKERQQTMVDVKENEWVRQLIVVQAIPPSARVINTGKHGYCPLNPISQCRAS